MGQVQSPVPAWIAPAWSPPPPPPVRKLPIIPSLGMGSLRESWLLRSATLPHLGEKIPVLLRGSGENCWDRRGAPSPHNPAPSGTHPCLLCLPGQLYFHQKGILRAAWILTLIKRKCPPGVVGLIFLFFLGTFAQPLSRSLVSG